MTAKFFKVHYFGLICLEMSFVWYEYRVPRSKSIASLASPSLTPTLDNQLSRSLPQLIPLNMLTQLHDRYGELWAGFSQTEVDSESFDESSNESYEWSDFGGDYSQRPARDEPLISSQIEYLREKCVEFLGKIVEVMQIYGGQEFLIWLKTVVVNMLNILYLPVKYYS